MSYKRNAGSNRDALFGSSGATGGGGPSYKANAAANRDALFGGAGGDAAAGGGGTSASSAGSGGGRGGAARPAAAASAARPGSRSSGRPAGGSRPTSTSSASSARASTSTSTSSRTSARPSRTSAGVLTGAAKAAKMKEADEYRSKAKKAMTRSVFSSPDPIGASTYYKRAADAYKACGENRLERLHRIANAECQMSLDAYATAATEYMRAAQLVEESADESPDRRSKEVNKLYTDAAEAWRQQNEFGRAGECMMKAAFGLLIGNEEEESGGGGGGKTMNMDKNALKAIEEAIEVHVPDLLNRYASFRQLGMSDYFDPNADPNDPVAKRDALELARSNMVKKSYAHETVYKACYKLIRYGEYPSALYAAGAATALIGADGFATISLSRAFVTETILSLALGDVVGADRQFVMTHLQKDSYLKARESKLAEDLIRAIKAMDDDALEEARSASGSNSAALANLGDSSLRNLVKNLRVSGRASRGPAPATAARPQKKKAPPRPTASPAGAVAAPVTAPVTDPAGTTAKASAPPKRTMLEGEELESSLDANFAELDGLMDDMGLGDDSDGEDVEDGNDYGGMGAAAPAVAATIEEEDDDDFDVDLR